MSENVMIDWPQALWTKLAYGVSTPPGDTGKTPEWPWVLTILLSAVLIAVNYSLQSFGRFLARQVGLSGKKEYKYGQTFMELINYAVSFLIGFIVIRDQSWLWPLEQWFTEKETILSTLNIELHFFYVYYFCRYVQGLISLIYLEGRKKDFKEMALHHVVTLGLVFSSWRGGWVKIGLIIMVLFDSGDPPLHLAKLCKYATKGKPSMWSFMPWSIMADIVFAFFAVVFTFTRVFIFAYVVWATIVICPTVTTVDMPYKVCCLLLVILLGLQVFWEYYLCLAIYNVVAGKDLGDSRSETDTDDDNDDKRD